MQHKTIPEMQAEIRQLREALQIPGVPDDEKQIYAATIRRIEAQISAMQAAPVTPPPPPPPKPEPIKHTAPPPSPAQPPLEGERGGEQPKNQHPITNQPITVRTPGAQPTPKAIPATLHVEHDTDPYNPEITIRWADGYHLRVNEAAARSRFKSTFQDTHALKVVKERRFDRIWRWDSPWRAAGFYQALTHFYGGQAPTAYQCGIRYPSDTANIIFKLITHTALSADTPAKADTKQQ